MKRKVTACLLAVAMAALSLAALCMPAAATPPMEGDIWSVYTLVESANGLLTYGVPPESSYGEDGLNIRPAAKTEYTVQSDHAYPTEDGFFMELRIEDTELFSKKNQLVFHLWSQVGTIVGYDRSGSGYYGMITVAGDVHYLIGMGVVEGDGSGKEESKLFGVTKLRATRDAEGRFLYTFAAVDGVLYINGQALEQSQEITAFLHEVCSNGEVHVGATIVAAEGDDYTPLTLTRFGRTQATAAVPTNSSAPEPPAQETDSASPVDPEQPTEPDVPRDTDPSADPSETDDPAVMPEQTDTSTSVTEPADPSLDESGDSTHTSEGDGDPSDTAPSDGTGTVEDNMAQNTLDFFNKINVFGGCGSSLTLCGVTALAAILSAAALTLKKKD